MNKSIRKSERKREKREECTEENENEKNMGEIKSRRSSKKEKIQNWMIQEQIKW